MTDNPTPFELTKQQLATLLEGKYLVQASSEDLKTIVKIISTWDEKPSFSNETIRKACLIANADLILEMVKRSDENVCLETCLPFVMSRFLSRATKEQRDQCCTILIPLLPKKDLSILLEMACKENLPKTFEMILKETTLSHDESEEMLNKIMESSLNDKSFSNDEQEVVSRTKILHVLLPSIKKPLSYGRHLWMATYSGLSYLEQIAPFTDNQACAKLLVKLLTKEYVVGGSKFKESDQPELVEFLYQEGKRVFLSYTDEQLDLFLPKEKYPIFWDVHEKCRLHTNLSQSVEPYTEKTSPFPKKCNVLHKNSSCLISKNMEDRRNFSGTHI